MQHSSSFYKKSQSFTMKRLIKLIPPNVQQQLTLIQKKQQIISQSLPAKLRPNVQVTGVEEHTVTISVNGQNWANNLRYYQEQMIDALRASTNENDWQLRIRASQGNSRKENNQPEEIKIGHSAQQTEGRDRLRKVLNSI